MLPFGWHVSDAIAGLIGSAAGSLAGVAGVVWLWNLQERRTETRALSAIDSACGFLIKALIDQYEACRPEVLINETLNVIDDTEAAIFHFIARTKRYEGHLFRLDTKIQDSHLRLEDHLTEIRTAAGETTRKLQGGASIPIGDNGGELARAICATTPDLKALAPNSMAAWPKECLAMLTTPKAE